MQVERKQLIRYALDLEIDDVVTYSGYKGDLVVKITTKDMNAVAKIRKFAMELDMKEVVVKQNSDLGKFEIFCITADEDVYNLKRDEVMDEIHTQHAVQDMWDEIKLK